MRTVTAPGITTSRHLSTSTYNRVSTPAVAFSKVFRTISRTNPHFSALLGMDDAQVLHRKVDSLIHPQYLDGFYDALRATTPCSGTNLVFLHSTGATRPLPTAITRFRDGYLMRVFSRQTDLLFDSGASMNGIGAGIVHDANNALGGGVGYVGLTRLEVTDLHKFLMALAETQDPTDVLRDLPEACAHLDEISKGLDAIGLSYDHLSSILRGFQAFCSRQPVNDKNKSFEVPDAIRSAVAIGKGVVADIAKDKGIIINLSHDGPEEKACAFGNSEKLQRILLNLIRNAALEFKSPNNCIEVEWSTTKNAAGERFVVINVKDSGPRIPKELADRLFRERVESTHGGTGIGLFTCAQMIHEYGGEIRYHSLPDKCFVITLKAAEQI